MTVSAAAAPDEAATYVVPYRPVREFLTGPIASISLTLMLVLVVGLIAAGPRFLSFGNISIMGNFLIVPLVIASFSGFALMSGVVDLSIGSMVAFSAAVFAKLLTFGWNPLAAAAVTIVACAAFGVMNAVAIVGFRANPIAVTLGMLTALRGLAWVIVGGTGRINAFNIDLFTLVNMRVFGLPLFFLISVAMIGFATLLVTKMRLGRHVKAVGGDEQAAERAGISVPTVRSFALVASAIGASLGGMIFVAQLGSAGRFTGFMLEFQVYAALMIGGYSILRGGVGNPLGGALGLIVVAGMTNILDLTAYSPYFLNIIVGILLMSAVLLDRLRGGDAYE